MQKFANPYFETLDKEIASRKQPLKNQEMEFRLKLATDSQIYAKDACADNTLFIIGNGFDLYHGAILFIRPTKNSYCRIFHC